MGGDGFGRCGEIDHGLREREVALGRAKPLVGVPGGDRLRQRLRIGQPDVLDSHTHDAARDIDRMLAAREHAREPVEGRVHVRGPHRLVERADQVVVAFLCLVVERSAALHGCGDAGGIERSRRR